MQRLLCLSVLFLSPAILLADNWPQWRGADFDGICKEKNLPIKWDEGTHILWKVPMPGMGSSTPCVWGDRIFLTSEAEEKLILMCFSTDGKELWRATIGAGKTRARSDEGNLASASPSTDGKLVFAFVGSGEVVAYDFAGKEVWKFNAQDRYGKFNIQFGMHSTPILFDGKLYFQLIHTGTGLVICIDAATGKEIWKVVRKSDGYAENEHSYASPCLWKRGDQAYLVTHGNDYAIAHDLKDGSEIWRLGDLNPKAKYNPTLRFVASPVAVADLIVVPSAKKGPVVGVKPDSKGIIMKGNPAEQWRRDRDTPDVPSPLVVDGLVYLCTETGNLICLDAKTGQEYYNQGTHRARHRASPVYADGHVYLTSRDGVFTVVKAGKTFTQVAQNRLKDDFNASPVFSNGVLYLRGFNNLYAIGSPK